jgi:hypothetical protein
MVHSGVLWFLSEGRSKYHIHLCECSSEKDWFQASAVVYVRSVLIWDFVRHRMLVSYWHFETAYRSHLQE